VPGEDSLDALGRAGDGLGFGFGLRVEGVG
jgi:hypothetical protein